MRRVCNLSVPWVGYAAPASGSGSPITPPDPVPACPEERQTHQTHRSPGAERMRPAEPRKPGRGSPGNPNRLRSPGLLKRAVLEGQPRPRWAHRQRRIKINLSVSRARPVVDTLNRLADRKGHNQRPDQSRPAWGHRAERMRPAEPRKPGRGSLGVA